MTLNEFQALSKRTINVGLTANDATIHAVLGMVSECHEYETILYKPVTTDADFENVRNELIKELGDLMWFVSEYATVNGYTLGECCHEYALREDKYTDVKCLSDAVSIPASRHQKMYQGKLFTDDERKEAIGAVIEQVMNECRSFLHVDADNVLERNVEKLIKRYPEGFSVERSENRNEDEE